MEPAKPIAVDHGVKNEDSGGESKDSGGAIEDPAVQLVRQPHPKPSNPDQPLHVLWDSESASIPFRFDPLRIPGALSAVFRARGYTGNITISCFCAAKGSLTSKLTSRIQAVGIPIFYADGREITGKQAADILLTHHLYELTMPVNASVTVPAYILVVSSDGGYLKTLYKLRLAGFTTGIMFIPGKGTMGKEGSFGNFLHDSYDWQKTLADSPKVNPAEYGFQSLRKS